jgi:hypothetical protein
MRKEMLMEVAQKVFETIFLIFVVLSSILLLKHLIVSILKIIAIYYIYEIFKFAKIFGL